MIEIEGKEERVTHRKGLTEGKMLACLFSAFSFLISVFRSGRFFSHPAMDFVKCYQRFSNLEMDFVKCHRRVSHPEMDFLVVESCRVGFLNVVVIVRSS